jgi:hypothetical protein
MSKDKFDSQDFYDIMQHYRHIPLTLQSDLVKAFEDVKEFAREEVEETSKEFALLVLRIPPSKKNKGIDVDELYKDFKKMIKKHTKIIK